MLEGVFVHEAIKVLGQGTGDFRGSNGAGAIYQPLDPLVCEAMDPFAQGGMGVFFLQRRRVREKSTN